MAEKTCPAELSSRKRESGARIRRIEIGRVDLKSRRTDQDRSYGDLSENSEYEAAKEWDKLWRGRSNPWFETKIRLFSPIGNRQNSDIFAKGSRDSEVAIRENRYSQRSWRNMNEEAIQHRGDQFSRKALRLGRSQAEANRSRIAGLVNRW